MITIKVISDDICFTAASALGIEAASFASVVYGASKDIAESPTAIAGTPRLIYNL